MRYSRKLILSCSLMLGSIICLAAWIFAQDATDPLAAGFQDPPNSAKPRVWWHWMNGNITKEGIKLDLEWMKRVGIGGFQNFDAALNTPKLVDKRLTYMTPEWKDAFLYATKMADQLGLEEAIAGSPGWSESGGPWVKPEEGMKKFVWSETVVEGGQPFSGKLPKPPSTTGPYQNIPMFDFLALISGQKPPAPPEFYADSAVIAYRAAASENAQPAQPKVTSSSGTLDAAVLSDGDFQKSTSLPKAPEGQQAWVQFEYAQPQIVRALTLALGGPVNPFADVMGGAAPGPEVQASDDGKSYHKVAEIPNHGAQVHTVSFPEVKAKFFRVAFTSPVPKKVKPRMEFDTDFGSEFAAPPAPAYSIVELKLHAAPRVNRVEEKAAFATLTDLYQYPTPPVAKEEAIQKANVVDLTSKMKPDGSLAWTPPAGRWIVMRFGYSLLGITNHPASPEATGLEVDKLNPDFVRRYMNTYLDNYKDTVGPLMGKKGLQYVINDSWEAGTQNWTDNLIPEFTKRRGYDPRPWLPVLTGRIIEDAASSDRFLWDFRSTLSDMLAEYHYDLVTAILKQRGMGHYGESHESGRAFIGDGMQVKRSNDVPMSAMWTQKPGVNEEQYAANADIRESASVAHIYGQNLVAAESMTASSGAWSWSPQTLKPTADKEMAMGLNRFVIHTSVHQPLLDKAPGLSLGPFGQWFTRNETWAEQAKVWTTYLARNSYMLQQGRFVADILYYYGEDSNLTALFAHKNPDVPAGYNFDYVNADALLHKISVDDGQLASASGMRYRVLVLDPFSQNMSLPVLRKIRDLVSAGAIVVGTRPTATPSLSDDPKEFQTISEQLWGSSASAGKGKVYEAQKLGEALNALHAAPDFEFTKPQGDTALLFVHRKLADGDVYFVDNRNDRFENVVATFRVDGKEAELWHADTGIREPASYTIANSRTTVPLALEPWGTILVVFRNPAKATSRVIPKPIEKSLTQINGSWDVAFQPDRGAPPKLTLDKLASFSDNADAGVKYFAGTATYTKTIQAPVDWFQPGRQLWIDLGDVKNVAEVSLNGKPLGVAWKTPFRVDATSALRAGDNSLEVKVFCLWRNRIIGDHQPNAGKTYAFTSPKFFKADSPLIPSGLLGPVQIIQKSLTQ
ncbi:MAG: hypothetical protein NVS9B4_07190 [Candidatus Acidiferrum sp.]